MSQVGPRLISSTPRPMNIRAMRVLCLSASVTGVRQEALPQIRLMPTHLWLKLMYSRSGKTIQQVYVMAIGKTMASKTTAHTGRKNQEPGLTTGQEPGTLLHNPGVIKHSLH